MGDDDFLRRVDEAVRDTRSRTEWRERYMRFDIRLMERYADGKSEERAATDRRNSQLAAALTKAGRADEAIAALQDRDTYEKFLAEFGIDSDGETSRETDATDAEPVEAGD